MTTISMKTLIAYGAFCISGAALASVTPTEAVWVGGESGDLTTASNWSPAKVPHTKSTTTAYRPVFRNSASVTLSANSDYWQGLGGFVVSNSSDVVFLQNGSSTTRLYAPNADVGNDGGEGTNFVFDIEAGSSLKLSGIAFRGKETVDLVKTGGGMLWTTLWLGNTATYREVDVREGVLKSTAARANNRVPRLRVRSGATFQTTADGGLSENFNSSVILEDCGLYDAGGKSLTFAHLNGSGVVSNVTTVTVTGAGENAATDLFAGRIYGSLKIAPTASTPENSGFTVGAADTLAEATLSVDTSACPTFKFRFAAGIGTFFCKSFPADVTFYDTDGKPVTLIRKVWYVDPTRVSSGDGKTPGTAFATLAEALSSATNPEIGSGDVVYALPGWYTNGTMVASANNVQTNRVIVPRGVRLVSTKGAAETFLVGAPSPEPVESGRGCGPGAIRCAALGEYALLRGFTVTNGFTYCKVYNSGDYYGGGVTGGTVEDCVVVGCCAVRGGGANSALCRRCRFVANKASYIGAATKDGECYNCLFEGHTTGNYVALYSKIVNCTFLADNSVDATWTAKDSTEISIVNSLFLCKNAGRDQANFQNCAFVSNADISDANIGPGSFKKPIAELKVKARTGQPRRGSPVVDAGDVSLYSVEKGGSLDFRGKPRQIGEGLDIGATEYDPADETGLLLIFR